MREIKLHYHHTEMLNNVVLLLDPELGEHIERQIKEQTSLTDQGISFLHQLSLGYNNW